MIHDDAHGLYDQPPTKLPAKGLYGPNIFPCPLGA